MPNNSSEMAKIYLLEKILLYIMIAASLITGYMTLARIFLHETYISYDAWIFAMCTGISLQLYDYHTIGNLFNTPLHIKYITSTKNNA